MPPYMVTANAAYQGYFKSSQSQIGQYKLKGDNAFRNEVTVFRKEFSSHHKKGAPDMNPVRLGGVGCFRFYST